MYFYKKENGSVASFFRPLAGLEEITKEEFDAEMSRIESEQKYDPKPTSEERLEAQVLYTALMTDTLLEV